MDVCKSSRATLNGASRFLASQLCLIMSDSIDSLDGNVSLVLVDSSLIKFLHFLRLDRRVPHTILVMQVRYRDVTL